MKPTTQHMERIWTKVVKTSGCWEWQGQLCKGYGVVKIRGLHHASLYVHRLVYLAEIGDIPAGFSVLHRCDNPKCVRPDHLFLGTQVDNVADMKNKQRQAKGQQHWTQLKPHRIVRGEDHPNAKLTADEVRTIRQLVSTGKSLGEIANLYGRNKVTIFDIVHRRTWKELQ